VTWLGVANPPDDKGIRNSTANTDGSSTVTINLMAINKPTRYILMADSYTTRPGLLKGSQYCIVQGGGYGDEIHLRHNKRANILFADGHVSACDANELAELGWHWTFDSEGKLNKL
jgi:prepilin-type processing-associated H-X9-DG protein